MLQNIISSKKNQWVQSNDCTVKHLLDYIRRKGELRDTQIEAIETYLFLKIVGENKPLWQLFSEGFFASTQDLTHLNINQRARTHFENNKSALALYNFASQKNGATSLLPDLEKLIVERPETVAYESIIKSMFYGVHYSDYLFSLPMGAGKTYLMAALMYLDLYFALNESDNKNFAHNFLVLVPSGLKSSIVPSLKTIEKFDPSWVLSEPAASRIKGMIRFEVLDQAKSAKRSNKARNPNAQKVNQYASQQGLMGLVLVVNAEKVILDRLELSDQQELIEHTEDQKDRLANELRNIIGKLPNLQIMIDEVHHAATDDIKLRQVVNRWNDKGSVTTVLGFSGTPYLSSPDAISVSADTTLKFSQITNTVYYYPLVTGIRNFLKKPTVKFAEIADPLHIIEKGIEDFYRLYRDKVYLNRTIAKIAIYCGNIQRLENDIYPFIIQLAKKFGDTEDNILKYHRGNKVFKLPKQNELEFNSLDTGLSKKRIILLVQIGKEGWDCKSLTGVILAQRGDCPQNMVLQTSCRCLRQVDKGENETALVWLNADNAQTLNKQLREEQQTSIQEINNLTKASGSETVARFPRVEYLQLPAVDFYQMRIDYLTIEEEQAANTAAKLKTLFDNIDTFRQSSFVVTRRNFTVAEDRTQIYTIGSERARFTEWLLDIAKGSFGGITLQQLQPHQTVLRKIFDSVTYTKESVLLYNEIYLQNAVKSQVRVAFSIKRSLETKRETIKQSAQMLLVEKLSPVDHNENIYPSPQEAQQIINYDATGKSIEEVENALQLFYEEQKKKWEEQGLGAMAPPPQTLSAAIRHKDSSFHYLPYSFFQSGFEKGILENTLTLNEFKQRKLEMYYNGERALTQFQIQCFAKNGARWQPVGKYTPDFLMIRRKRKNELHKILIIETKGEGFSHDPKFLHRKNYVSSEFLRLNEEKFGYKRFEFLYLSDESEMNDNLSELNHKIIEFFND